MIIPKEEKVTMKVIGSPIAKGMPMKEIERRSGHTVPITGREKDVTTVGTGIIADVGLGVAVHVGRENLKTENVTGIDIGTMIGTVIGIGFTEWF